jgi:hypothetical protein
MALSMGNTPSNMARISLMVIEAATLRFATGGQADGVGSAPVFCTSFDILILFMRFVSMFPRCGDLNHSYLRFA